MYHDYYETLRNYLHRQAMQMISDDGTDIKRWDPVLHLTLAELQEIEELQSTWGKHEWRKHTSRALVRAFDRECERQKFIQQ